MEIIILVKRLLDTFREARVNNEFKQLKNEKINPADHFTCVIIWLSSGTRQYFIQYNVQSFGYFR